MKKVRVAIGIVVGVVVVAVAAIWMLANPNTHREWIQSQLESQLGRKVTLGEMSLGFMPLRFQVQNPVIAEDPQIGQQPFVRAEKLDLQIRLLPLLRGNVQVDSLELIRPSVDLIKTQQGMWNFSTLGAAKTPAGTTAEGPPSKSGGTFSLSRTRITDGQIGITNLQQRRPRAVYDHIDLTLVDYNPADNSFHGTLNVKQAGIEGLLQLLDTRTVKKAKGVLSLDSEMESRSGTVSTKGKLKLDGAQFNDLDIGYPIELNYNLDAQITSGLVTIETTTLHLGSTPLVITGVINTSSTPPNLDLNIKSGDVSISEIARLASAFGVAFAPGTSVSGRVNADIHAKGPSTKPALTGSINGRDLNISGQGMAEPVQVKTIALALSPTAIRSNEFNATSGKTTVVGQFSLLEYASNSPSVDLGLRAPGATLPEIQSLAKAYGVTALDQLTGQGTLNFDLRAKGPLESLNQKDAIRALNGTINVDFSPLKIAGFDTAHELGKLGGFASNLSDSGSTDIVKLVGQVIVKNGIAQTDDLRAQLGIGNLAASGTADLASEALNLKLQAVFTKAFSEKAGGTRPGALLNTALSNSNGEIVLPAIVTGSFKKPTFSPDLKAIAELQKKKLMPSLSNPSEAVGKVKSGLKGILDVFGGKKK